MKLVVCIKQVVDPNAQLTIDNLNIGSSSPALRTNEFDEYALEEALRIKEANGAEVTVISLGPLTCVSELNRALAMGADKAIRIDDSVLPTWDAYTTARVLAAAITRIGFDLILCGIQATDDLYSQVGVLISESLGIPHAYAVTRVEIINGAASVNVTKELGSGMKQQIEVPMPAVLIIQSGINLPRYVSVLGLIQSRAKRIEGINPNSLYGEEELQKLSKLKLISLSASKKERKSELIEGKSPEIAKRIVAKLQEDQIL